ncbi:MAG: WecB/TagA/CpsF family glycosyltransferase [Planctomycetes bacterium]|nr:WecB/TagA/CpsF family glycosyltransferase [Planctomycetota bacterium]
MERSPDLPKIDLFGIRITRATGEEIVQASRDAVRTGRRAETLLAVNAHTYVEARRNTLMGRVLNEAFIAWPDGVAVAWAARLSGRPTGPRIHGHDLMLRFLREPFSHYFYGSTPEVLADMRRRLDGVRIAGMQSPPLTKRAERCDVSAINNSGADILWVALGAPKQELWAHLNRDRIRVPLIVCIGAAFELLAGRFSRAPRLLQRAGLEWAWRLSQDPARLWRRYVSTNGAFAAHVLGGLLAHTFSRPGPASHMHMGKFM